MKVYRKILPVLLSFAMLISAGCGRKETVKNEDLNFIGFKFFFFYKKGDDSFNASGEGALKKDGFFKLRVYDNLLSRHIADYVSYPDGRNQAIVAIEKVIYQRADVPLSEMLCWHIPSLFRQTDGDEAKRDKRNVIFLENNWIKYIILHYGKREIRLEVVKRYENGMPKRIKISEGDSLFVLDIVEYTMQDFIPEKGDYQLIDQVPGEGFFDWIGAFHGER